MDPALLDILACPNCDDRPPLREMGPFLVCDRCQSVYPIVDGIPHLLPEDARPVSEVDLTGHGE
jgi:uncharacterized protein